MMWLIPKFFNAFSHGLSHPSRVRGLKQYIHEASLGYPVAPFAGAWIETVVQIKKGDVGRRTLRGCVD